MRVIAECNIVIPNVIFWNGSDDSNYKAQEKAPTILPHSQTKTQ